MEFIGRHLAAGDGLESFLCTSAIQALEQSLREAVEMTPLMLTSHLKGPASQELKAHLLVVRQPQLELEPPGSSYLLAVRLDHSQEMSEVLPQLTRLHSGSTNGSGAETTVTGALFNNVELNGVGLGRLLEMGHREHWLISTELLQLHVTKLLGSGGFGLVCEGSFCGAPVAMKFARRGEVLCSNAAT